MGALTAAGITFSGPVTFFIITGSGSFAMQGKRRQVSGVGDQEKLKANSCELLADP
jgi:hypothetical protein